ncbi:lasso peptide biosynthesis PqqD family chaperone [Streptomyces sp. 7N604]|uniref:lasso peptide biosynthesis PqqD family chaperone n=1 Tax=Streptomyces sp. 7N604 TaxID=3457415 RepID=UPI003FD286EE
MDRVVDPYAAPPDVSLTDTDDGTVLLHQRTGRYWQLNITGSRVLRRLLDGDTSETIAADLTASYGIDPQRAADDVGAAIRQLRSAELTVTGELTSWTVRGGRGRAGRRGGGVPRGHGNACRRSSRATCRRGGSLPAATPLTASGLTR